MRLKQASILIAGGRRIGASLAEMLARRGARLTLTYFQSADAIESAADLCRNHGADVLVHQADLRDPAQVELLMDAVRGRFGKLDALINLTSIYRETPFSTLTPADYDDLLASNLTAPYHTAVAAAKLMREQPAVDGLQGKIVFFADWAVDRPYRDHLPYLVAKGGVVTLTKALAVELAPTIPVNAIAPGTVLPSTDKSPEHFERIARSSLLGRLGHPDDVNRLVLYLLEGTDFATGEIFRVDGGRFYGPAA